MVTKIYIAVVSLVIICVVASLSVYKPTSPTSHTSILSKEQIDDFSNKANNGDALAASKLVDYHVDHTMNYNEAYKWMNIAIKNGATWYSEKDLNYIREIAQPESN